MSTFKKYLLVDPEKYKQLLSKTQTPSQSDILTHPNIKTVREIDNKMTQILNNNYKSDQEKIEEYSSNLDSYLRNFKNALEVPKKEAILGEKRSDTRTLDIQNSTEPENYIEKTFFNSIPESIPVSYRPKATHLLSFLTKNKNFEISQNGELKYKGKRSFQSDYNKLLDSVVRSKKLSDGNGDTKEFVTLLKQEGYPVNRLAYVRRNQVSSLSTKPITSATLKSKKPTKLHQTINRLSSGNTPKRNSSSKILKQWAKT